MTTLQKQIIKTNEGLDGPELLNWAMNQLFRAARTLDLAAIGAHIDKDNPSLQGCDATATTILKRLVKTKRGWDIVYMTNPKLLRGYRKPKK